jgi:hypothetical protein
MYEGKLNVIITLTMECDAVYSDISPARKPFSFCSICKNDSILPP